MLIMLFSLLALPVSFTAASNERQVKIVMIWDYIGRTQDNLRPDKRIVHAGLDVISPTWFSIRNRSGNVASLASREYVQWAHSHGIKVWALFENKSDDQLTYEALFTRSRRQRMINQIAGYAEEFRLDGINIDFEAMSRRTGRLFETFIAELYEKLKPMGVTLSVDISFPVSYAQTIYDVSLIAKNSDYVIIMAYDQHHAESEKIGPAAAIDWVKRGIEEALNYFSNEKMILGIPFYSIVWFEDKKNTLLKARPELRGMKEAYDMFDKTAVIWGRDRITEQIYAEFENEEVRCKAWLEDDHSISLKLDTINDYNLAGMSAWRRGLEWPETWDMIKAYFN